MKTASELGKDIVFTATIGRTSLTFSSTWGLFSPKGIDDGSLLLMKHVCVHDGQATIDLGCGYGPIGLFIAKSTPNGSVHMVDKDYIAVEYAEKNAAINQLKNCRIYLSNAFSNVGDTRFHNVVSNLPANAGREMLYIMLSGAKEHLARGGQIVVVTISGLKEYIKRNFMQVFGNYEKIKQGRAHVVSKAVKR
jgi:16S rRNA G1207 methylase RsmC